MLNIQPIKLLKGSHDDTGQTGSGCFMNVIAYLNGEPQITDESPCVCRSIRAVAIWTNDAATDSDRQRLLPFIHRAMGTATEDPVILRSRVDHLVALIVDLAKMAQECMNSMSSARTASEIASSIKTSTNPSSLSSVQVEYFGSQAVRLLDMVASTEQRSHVINRAIKFLDAALPAANVPDNVLIERAQKLVESAKS